MCVDVFLEMGVYVSTTIHVSSLICEGLGYRGESIAEVLAEVRLS